MAETRTYGPKRIEGLRFDGAIGGRMAISGTVVYDNGGDEHAIPVTFTGPTTPGYPGPVMMRQHHREDHQRVVDPERFGDTFGADWVLSFFGLGK